MSGPSRRFDPRELAGADVPPDADDATLRAVAQELEALAAIEASPRPADFEDRIMAALADEPPPRPIARGWSPVAIAATVRDAWRLATTGPRPAAVRAQAMALVLLVAVAGLSVGSLAAVGVARWLSSDPALPPPVTPSPPPSLVVPTPSSAPIPTLTPSPSPSPSASPSPSPTSSPDPTGTAAPTETADPTEGTDDPDDTPKPTETERPTDTPDPDDTPGPEDTPEPTETDDNSGPGGGEDDGSENSGPGGG